MNTRKYPDAVDFEKVGSYSTVVGAGGGFVWDEVLEYRVWLHPERGAPDEEDGSDYYYSFATYDKAFEYSQNIDGADAPVALIQQREHISEPEPGRYVHITEERLTEWPVVFLSRPRRTPSTIPDFLAPDAPPNRLDILRGFAMKPSKTNTEP